MSLIHRWMRPPLNLFGVLAAITVVSAAALGWLGWEMLRQEQAAEAQREQERLGHQADLAVQAFERMLSEAGSALREFGTAPPTDAPAWSRGGLTFVFTPEAVLPTPPDRLLFYPVLPDRAEAPTEVFAAAEVTEVQGRADGAVEIYRRLAQTNDPPTRAAALMRLGRTLLNSGNLTAALKVYGDLAALDAVPVIGLPAGLIARTEEVRLLHQLGRRDDALDRAKTLVADLERGRWTLAQGQYEHYAEQAAALAGMPARPAEHLGTPRAVADLWESWRTTPASSGQRVGRMYGVPRFVAWHSTKERLAGWVIAPDQIVGRLGLDAEFKVALSDAAGFVFPQHGYAGDVTRAASDTRLPWTVHVSASGATASPSGVTRGRLVVAGLVVMLVFLSAGSYFVGRAVKHEMDLARLQSDFVSAVSHEFRTPLAAMRQLSELLAAGRVPLETRRQHYYESLANESRRLQRLVENLLNFGRLEAGARPYDLEPLDPRALVEEVVSDFRSQLAQPECRIEVADSHETGPLLGDREAIALALHNLVDNAVKYAGHGHTVTIDWARQGERIALSVRDDGPGIPKDEQARIFQRFVRGTTATAGRVRGTGIGLATVALVVRCHGGEVLVDSQPGAGATFTMLLPAAQAT